MNNFKFRAWDKGTDGAEPQGMSYNQKFCHTMILNNDGFIIMQSTGLHDKNGVEIYEGDILTSLYKFEGCGGVYEIIWKDAKFIPIKRGEHQQNGVSISMNDMTRCEVIGNIYENPELLTKHT